MKKAIADEEDMTEGSPAEEAAETPDVEQKEMEAGEGDAMGGEGVKVPEGFQKEAAALVSSCSTMACLDYLSSEINDQRKKLMSSQKKSGNNTDDFNTDGMPME